MRSLFLLTAAFALGACGSADVRKMVTGKGGDYPAGIDGLVAAGSTWLVLSLVLAGGATWWIANGVPGL